MSLPLGMTPPGAALSPPGQQCSMAARSTAVSLRYRRINGERVPIDDAEQRQLIDDLARWWRHHPTEHGERQARAVAPYAGGLPLWGEVETAHSRMVIEAEKLP